MEYSDNNPIALKEWAVAIKALREGGQILVLRKGGIVEETRDFQLESHDFYLYPTYEHQKKELVKEAYREALDQAMDGWSADDTTVPLTVYAHVVEDIEIADQEELNRLSRFHIWTDTFAEERLKWKKTSPLHLLLLRVYELEQIVKLPIADEYLGCKSWVRIPDPIPKINMHPVLDDAEFNARVQEIRGALKRSFSAEA
ncbi:MAG: hypothetical protein K0R57_2599 [Paenibacillaceae bacterium]|jgi:hypothetical protein|nr:hypothetical protein [Paenibacillaceae bacterium]